LLEWESLDESTNLKYLRVVFLIRKKRRTAD